MIFAIVPFYDQLTSIIRKEIYSSQIQDKFHHHILVIKISSS